MKKTVILAAMLAAPAFAGQTVITPTTAIKAPAAPAQWGVEIGYNCAWGAKDIATSDEEPCKEMRTHGVDITLVRPVNENNAFTLRFGYNYGSRSWGGYDVFDGDESETIMGTECVTFRSHTFSLMPGYRYTHALCDKVSAYVGVNAGLTNQSLKFRDAASVSGVSLVDKVHGSQWSLGYSAEVGLRYAITDKVDFFVAYQFTGNTCKPKLTYTDEDGSDTFRGKAQNFHGFRTGFGVKF